jgi:ubiquinone/menaquinone biosynthesis C-methylase UbiE
MHDARQSKQFIPALSFHKLTPLYDILIGLTMPEKAFKGQLVAQSAIKDDHRVLDLGCGTATLTLLIKKAYPRTEVHGLDGDHRILKIARKKAKKRGASVMFEQGMAYELPYRSSSFDRVLTSLFFHHLPTGAKVRTLAELKRILRVGGQLHVADFGRPHNSLMRIASLPWRIFDGKDMTRDNVEGRIPELIRNAGFTEVSETTQFTTVFGTLTLYRALNM